MSEFFQEPPRLTNPFEGDALLRSYVRRKFPREKHAELETDYQRLGGRAIGEILQWARDAERNPPVHVPYDAWGRRIDRIDVSAGWKNLDRISAEEGLIAVGYERRNGALSRLDQFIRLYLFSPYSAFYSCPLAMTDGAARAIEMHGDEELKKGAFRHLISRDPSRFWTSGQWMTERTGGSDVSGTSTIARPDGDGYRLYGTKWFTSATTSQTAMTLARIEGAPVGSAGLSLFYLELRDDEGRLRDIRVHRLKDKLGTRALPTAELTLEGTPAKLVGSAGDGVKKISVLFNITRVYNACLSVGAMRRALFLARDYALRRRAFGKLLSEHALHLETLAELEVDCQAAFHLAFRAAELLGKEEVGEASAEEKAMLRLLTPIAKLFTARKTTALASEVVECFGGAGYIEDTEIPGLLRDAQVFSIWEGTTNVLSLDALRAMEKENALGPLVADLRRRVSAVRAPELAASVRATTEALAAVEAYAAATTSDLAAAGARGFAMALAQAASASLMLEHAQWGAENGAKIFVEAARRWCEKRGGSGLGAPARLSAEHVAASRRLAIE